MTYNSIMKILYKQTIQFFEDNVDNMKTYIKSLIKFNIVTNKLYKLS